ncbi:hypothetical protein D3C71_1677530 [compost metagenome]
MMPKSETTLAHFVASARTKAIVSSGALLCRLMARLEMRACTRFSASDAAVALYKVSMTGAGVLVGTTSAHH